MKPYQERALQEKEELDERIEKLTLFINDMAFPLTDQDEQHRLRGQLNAMAVYSYILGLRIANFELHESENT